MKKIYFTILAWSAVIILNAQSFVIDNTYAPTIEDKYTSYWLSDPANTFNPGAAGVVNWDFSGYSQDSTYQNYGTQIAATSQPTYPNANVALITSYGDTTFYQVTDTELTNWGYYSSILGKTVYSNGQSILRFPLTYGESYTDSVAGKSTIKYIGVTKTGRKGVVTVSYDGYGDLLLPNMVSYTSVARIKTIANAVDSILNPTTNTYISIPSTITSYFWYAQKLNYPVFSIVSIHLGSPINSDNTVAIQSGPYTTTAVQDAQLAASIDVAPNPVQDMLGININQTMSDAVVFTLKDLSGKTLLVSGAPAGNGSRTSINVSSLVQGFYVLEIESAGTMAIKKVIKN
jgi:hypothetical protein